MLSWLVHSVVDFICPPAKKPVLLQAESCFTKEELDAIRREHCVHVLSKYIQTVDDAHFLEWAGLQHAAPVLQQGLCRVVRYHSGTPDASAITLEGIIISKALCEKLDRQTAEDFAFDIMDLQQIGAVSRDHLEAVVLGCLQLAMPSARDHLSNTADAAAIAAGACSYSSPGASMLTRDGYTKLCKVSPALNNTLTTLLYSIGQSATSHGGDHPEATTSTHARREAASTGGDSSAKLLSAEGGMSSSHAEPVGQQQAGGTDSASTSTGRRSRSHRAVGAAQHHEQAGPGPGSSALAAAAAAAAVAGPGRLLPQLGWGLVSPEDGLLQPAWMWLLAAGLPPVQRLEWRLLFNSQKHGISFSTFMGRLGEACPTLLLIRDKGGALFGGIAHSPWKKTGSFYGDHASIIFRLLPDVQLYPASGINSNIQWCAYGFSQLPNGLGWGGQVGHYGVWLDATMDHGMSRPTATFASPSLSSAEVFQVDVVEAWQLMPPEDEPTASTATREGPSALSKAKEDQKILEWAGVGKNYSAALKDEPIED